MPDVPPYPAPPPPAPPLPPAPSSYPPGAPPPRGRRGGTTGLLAAIAVLAAVAVGTIGYVVVGGDDETRVRSDLTLADLEPALLTGAQVPDGFVQAEWTDNATGDDLGPDDVDASPLCEAALGSFALMGGAEQVTGTEFEIEETGATIEHTLSVAGPEDPDIPAIEDAIGACGEFAFDDGESSGTMSMSAMPIDGVGDAALLVVVGVRSSSGGFDVDLEMTGIMFERDGVQGTVAFMGGFDEDTLTGGPIETLPVDRDALRSAAEAADHNLDGIV
jgi:hypothetical protein